MGLFDSLFGEVLQIGGNKVIPQGAPLGEGGFAYVFVAVDKENPSRQYALKRTRCATPEAMASAKVEMRVLSQLPPHKNIVTFHGGDIRGNLDNQEVVILEELCVDTLTAMMHRKQKSKFSTAELFEIFKDVVEAISHLHSQQPPIAHRDVKPENILVGADGHFKLCDFGSCSTISKVLQNRQEILDEEEKIQRYSTLAYRAPEMCDLYAGKLLNEQVDVWALGCLLYAAAFNKLAFAGDSALSIINCKYQIPEDSPYPEYIHDLIRSCLVVDPQQRPTTFQLLDKLKQLQETHVQELQPASSNLRKWRAKNSSNNSNSPAATSPMLSPTPSSSSSAILVRIRRFFAMLCNFR